MKLHLLHKKIKLKSNLIVTAACPFEGLQLKGCSNQKAQYATGLCEISVFNNMFIDHIDHIVHQKYKARIQRKPGNV